MKKIFMIFFVFIFVCQSFIFSQNLNDFLLKYKNNQQKIQSLVSAGTLSVTLKNSEGTVINQTSNDMVIYMKYPDLFKIHMSGEFEMILVQKGDVVNQKIGANPVVTSKATETGNLMKSYFAIDIDESFDTSQVIRQNNFTDGEETYTIFELQYNQEINTKQTKIAAINKGDFYFNENGLMVKNIFYDKDGKVLVQNVIQYILDEGIYVTEKIRTTLNQAGIIMETLISYNSVSLNTTISDKEFEIK